MAITGGILLGVGAVATGGAAVYSAVKGDEFRDEQRQQMKKSEERQATLDKENEQQQVDADAQQTAIENRDQARKRKDALTPSAATRGGSILTSPLGIPSGSPAGKTAGGGGKTLLGM